MDKDKPKIGDADLGGEGLEFGDVKAAFCDALDLEKDGKGNKIESKEKKQKEKDEILPFEWFHIRQETKKEIKRIQVKRIKNQKLFGKPLIKRLKSADS